MDETLPLERAAAACPTARPALAARLAPGEAEAAAARALAARAPLAAGNLLLAGLIRGEAPPTALATAVAPYLDDPVLALKLVDAAEGDRVEAILDLCASERLSSDREAPMLLLAANRLEGAPAPARLRTRLRLVSRRKPEPTSQMLLGFAAAIVDDEHVNAVVGPAVLLAQKALAEGDDQALLVHIASPIETLLPERQPETVDGGYTLERETPKVGRNDPCPCGSGKKAKRCCGTGGPAPKTEGPPEVPYAATMTRDQFEDVRPMHLARLDPVRVATHHLYRMIFRLTQYAFYDEAERALDELARRADAHDALGHREDFLRSLLAAGERERARRVAEGLPPGVFDEASRLHLDLLGEEGRSVARLEALAREGHEQERHDRHHDLAYLLLEAFPALGILVARGVVDPARPLDAWALLDTIEEARDRLCLPPEDVAWELYERRGEFEREALAERALDAETERLAEQVEDLRAKAADEARRARHLEARLKEQEAALARLEPARPAGRAPAPRASDAAPPESARSGPAVPAAGKDVKALRRRVEELKTLLRGSAEERTRLRHQLRERTEELSQGAARADASPSEADDLEEEHGGGEEPHLRRPIVVPRFASRFEASLDGIPERIAREAVRVAGALAAGDATAWSGVKRMKSAPRVKSARLALAWRLLFAERDHGAVEMLEVVHRGDLERALARY